MVAEAIFHNHERVAVKAVYRDPVHDFGTFRRSPVLRSNRSSAQRESRQVAKETCREQAWQGNIYVIG